MSKIKKQYKKASETIDDMCEMFKTAKEYPVKKPDGSYAVPYGWEANNNPLDEWEKNYFKSYNVPEHYVRIGENGVGDTAFADPNTDNIYTQWHELEEEDGLTEVIGEAKKDMYSTIDNPFIEKLRKHNINSQDKINKLTDRDIEDMGIELPSGKSKFGMKDYAKAGISTAILGGLIGGAATKAPTMRGTLIGAGLGLGSGLAITGSVSKEDKLFAKKDREDARKLAIKNLNAAILDDLLNNEFDMQYRDNKKE